MIHTRGVSINQTNLEDMDDHGNHRRWVEPHFLETVCVMISTGLPTVGQCWTVGVLLTGRWIGRCIHQSSNSSNSSNSSSGCLLDWLIERGIDWMSMVWMNTRIKYDWMIQWLTIEKAGRREEGWTVGRQIDKHLEKRTDWLIIPKQ